MKAAQYIYCLIIGMLFMQTASASTGVSPTTMPTSSKGTLINVTLKSDILKENKIGLDLERKLKVYLPPSYEDSEQHYPVIYHFHSIYWDNIRMFESGHVKGELDRMIHDGIVSPFIWVSGDFTTPGIGTFYGNNAVAGRWIDHITQELVPFTDKHFRTLPKPQSRVASGEYLGAYAALKLGILHPNIFGVVYGLHPVGTAGTPRTLVEGHDWQLMNKAKSWEELEAHPRAPAFMTMAQNYLPNLDRPPFYADLMVELEGEQLINNSDNIFRILSEFHLEHHVHKHVSNLKKLTAIGFEWGRLDPNFDHVDGNRAFTYLLNNYGIAHQSEEYQGLGWDKNWDPDGRVRMNMMPFIDHHVAF